MSIFGKKRAFKTADKRKWMNCAVLQELKISYNPDLPARGTSKELKLKSLDTICKRAIAAIIAIRVACDISDGVYNAKGKILFNSLICRYDVFAYLNDKEYRIIYTKNYTEKEVSDVIWTYESYWSLVWALGLVDDIWDATGICDSKKATLLVARCVTYKKFKSRCKLRHIEDILDMLDLYYRYNWAFDAKKYSAKESFTGNLDRDVVIERLRGLEWLFSEEEDWFNLTSNT